MTREEIDHAVRVLKPDMTEAEAAQIVKGLAGGVLYMIGAALLGLLIVCTVGAVLALLE